MLPLLLILPGAASGAESATRDREGESAATVSDAPETAGPERRRRVVEVAGYLLLVLALAGGLLLTLLVAWGMRVRRLARRPLPPVRPVDPLWYLHPKPSAERAPPPDSGSSDSNS